MGQFWITKYGTKTAMLQVSVWSAIRMLTHVYAQYVGGARGVTLIVMAQLFCVLGTPGSFMLASNSAIMSLVPPEARTGMFGVLSGAQMAGVATGLLCESSEWQGACKPRRAGPRRSDA